MRSGDLHFWAQDINPSGLARKKEALDRENRKPICPKEATWPNIFSARCRAYAQPECDKRGCFEDHNLAQNIHP